MLRFDPRFDAKIILNTFERVDRDKKVGHKSCVVFLAGPLT